MTPLLPWYRIMSDSSIPPLLSTNISDSVLIVCFSHALISSTCEGAGTPQNRGVKLRLIDADIRVWREFGGVVGGRGVLR